MGKHKCFAYFRVATAEQIVENLESRGVCVKYLCYGDEGHGIMKLANKLDCYPQVADFLKTHLREVNHKNPGSL